jgi:hypothetical protein
LLPSNINRRTPTEAIALSNFSDASADGTPGADIGVTNGTTTPLSRLIRATSRRRTA